MPLIIFSFAFNSETKELTYTANIQPPEATLPMALRILQDALISQAVQRAGNQAKAVEKKAPKKVVAEEKEA
ncbi:hypothetical protein ES703_77623 [subsurface metagenome]